jgi:hypothetical protein
MRSLIDISLLTNEEYHYFIYDYWLFKFAGPAEV